jgi:hypothetical protein
MADAVTSNIVNGRDVLMVHLTNVSDGTGESAVVKVDKSAYVAADGAEPASLDIERVRWNIQGFTFIKLLWDHTTDDTALVLSGSGYEDFRGEDGPNGTTTPKGLPDPRSSGGAGDILLTTQGAAANASYDITLWVRKSGD